MQPGLGDALRGQRVLFPRDRGGGHPAAAGPGRVEGETAPAGADLEHMVVGTDPQLVADAIELALRGYFERIAVTGVQRRGIHHVFGQEQAEERIAEVVVLGDVAARPVAGIAAQRVQRAHRQAAQPGRSAFHRVEQVAVARQQLHQSHQVAAVPGAVHVRFGRADAAVAGQRAIEAGAVHRQSRDLAMSGLADAVRAERIGQFDGPAAQRVESTQQARAQEAVERAVAGGGCVRDAVHRRVSGFEGWSWTGVRFSHSRSACQWMPAITCAVISG
jgi:hypothetical protein